MPGSLKLNAVASIYAHNKPYNFFRSFSSSSVTNSAVIAAVRPNFPAVSSSSSSNRTTTTTTCCRRWRSATTLASSAFHGNGDFRNRKKFLGFSSAQEKNAGFPVRNISTTHMGPTPDHHNHHKEEDEEAEGEQWLDSKASPPALQNDHSGSEKASASPPEPSNSEKLLTLPTILTIGRVAAVPLLVSTFYVDSWWGPTATTALFIAAAITDWLDGYLARKMNLGTAFGAFLDPVADKLMVAATLVLLCTRPLESNVFGQLPWLLPVPSIAIIGREITMSAVREWAASQGSKLSEAVAVNNLGKWKTATQMIALTILLLSRDTSLSGTGTLVASGVILLYISAWLAVWSLFVYMRKILKALM